MYSYLIYINSVTNSDDPFSGRHTELVKSFTQHPAVGHPAFHRVTTPPCCPLRPILGGSYRRSGAERLAGIEGLGGGSGKPPHDLKDVLCVSVFFLFGV